MADRKGLTAMAFDAGLIRVADVSTLDAGPAPRTDFRRPERIVVLGGALALGAMAGFMAAMIFGPLNLWAVAAVAAPVLILALHLTSRTLEESFRRRAFGCAAAASLHGAALLAWPFTGLMMPLAPGAFWLAPLLAIATLMLSASCWGGPPRTVYRLGAQGVLVAALAAHQGAILIMGA